MKQERHSIVFITTSDVTVARCKQACEYFSTQPLFYASLQLFLDDERVRPRTLLVDLRTVSTQDINLLQKIKRIYLKTQVVGIVEKNEDRKSENYLQHYFTTELLSTFVFEYFLFQRNFCEFYEISPSDLFPDSMVYFNAYHFLPLNQKYLPLVHENFKLTEKRHRRAENIGTLYIDRSDSSAYAEYIKKYFDQFSVGLKKRSKSRTYQLLNEWRELSYSYLLNVKEVESFLTVRPDFNLWLGELLDYFVNSQDPFELIFELSRMPCFDHDRSLIELIVSSYLSRHIGEDEAEKLTDLRLLLTLCRLSVNSLLFKSWHLGQDLNEEEKKTWNVYPEFIQNYQLSPDFPAETLEDLKNYQNQFLTRTNSDIKDARLVHSYVAEVTVAIMQKFTSENYKKEDLTDSVLVKCKADGILQEAWIEELRQFFKKTGE